MTQATAENQSESTTGTTRFNLEFAFKLLEDEFETLFALSTALTDQLEREDSNSPDCAFDHVAWRLSQILVGRLERTSFLAGVRELMLGRTEIQRSEA